MFSFCTRRDTPSSSHYIFDAKGNVVGFFGPKFRTTGRHAHIKVEKPDSNASSSSSTKKRKAQRGQPRFNIHTPRQQLRRLLCDQIEPQNIQWGNCSLSKLFLKKINFAFLFIL